MIDTLHVDDMQIHGSGADYQITSVGGGFFGGPTPRTNRPDKPMRDGLIELSYFYGGRILELAGIVVGDDPGDALDKLDLLKNKFLLNHGYTNDFEQVGVNQGAPMHTLKRKLYVRDYQEYCRVTQDADFQAPMDLVSRVIPWDVTLMAQDPRWYTIETNDTADANGTVDGADIDYLYVDLADTDVVDFTVDGNTEALPWFEITGPFDGYALIQHTYDPGGPNEKISTDKVIYDLGGGNNIDVITRTRLAVKNSTIRHDIVDRENTVWFGMPPGPNQLYFSVGGGATGATKCRARWQTARL